MKGGREAFVGIDAAKAKNAVSVAEGGRQGEMRYLGEFDTAAVTVAKLVRKLAERARLHRAGELNAVWVPDETHEAVRDLVRARGGG